MPFNNAVNASQTGVQCLTSGGVWNGRTITAGTGISVSNGDGVSGNPTISTSGGSGGLGTAFLYDDFICFLHLSTIAGSGNTNLPVYWGGGATFTAINESGHPGIIAGTTGPNAADDFIFGPNYGIIAGAGQIIIQWVLKFPTLSNGTNRYTARIGLMDTTLPGGIVPANGYWFEYIDNVNSGNWVIKTANSTTTTSTNTNSAADTSWHNYKIIVNAGNTSAAFYIDGVQVSGSPITTNLPTNGFGHQISIDRIAGEGSQIYADLYILEVDLTTPRPG